MVSRHSVITLLENFGTYWMTPNDWHQLAKVCLPGGHFLLWKVEYEKEAKKEAGIRKTEEVIGLSVLLGVAQWIDPGQQLKTPKKDLLLIPDLVIATWRYLPASDISSPGVVNIKQKRDEPYNSFISPLTDFVTKIIPKEQATEIIKQLLYENTNNACKTLLISASRL